MLLSSELLAEGRAPLAEQEEEMSQDILLEGRKKRQENAVEMLHMLKNKPTHRHHQQNHTNENPTNQPTKTHTKYAPHRFVTPHRAEMKFWLHIWLRLCSE